MSDTVQHMLPVGVTPGRADVRATLPEPDSRRSAAIDYTGPPTAITTTRGGHEVQSNSRWSQPTDAT